ncbi:putative ligand-binding protein with streptavidin-like fold [Ectopseudomonas oleovorans]|uniref:Atu4866 domain-containing protein n=3 Tax=Pseudomonadales TaxID=72274 RepID=A0A7G5DU45_9PSED|nr:MULTISPECIES: Atu4866 domain-containing protein [Pseudomonas]QMV65270.1 Atu4866 domain-containing protein [Pseudomonas berkeleyensis]RIA22758.1 putative ligand-binding protein with streptavidin-like fold [Pseudomonas oleovorans]WSO40747.1 Atu4866 domain-containing protein [Pseudomonas berkeleyensis]
MSAKTTVAALLISGLLSPEMAMAEAKNPHPYVGMWVTDDGHVRHELLANGRYDEARGNRESAYQGSYHLTDNHIDYVDDTGFTADGEFIDDVLYHGGMVLRRQSRPTDEQ